jgi:hypothetical protein
MVGAVADLAEKRGRLSMATALRWGLGAASICPLGAAALLLAMRSTKRGQTPSRDG